MDHPRAPELRLAGTPNPRGISLRAPEGRDRFRVGRPQSLQRIVALRVGPCAPFRDDSLRLLLGLVQPLRRFRLRPLPQRRYLTLDLIERKKDRRKFDRDVSPDRGGHPRTAYPSRRGSLISGNPDGSRKPR
jgi:hypothetical protein